MARIFISGGISGVENYKERFDKVEEQLRRSGFAVVNPANLPKVLPESETTHEEYMKVCLKILSMCDAICMLDNWEQSRGARQEYNYAIMHGMKIFHLEDNSRYDGAEL